MTKTTKNTIKSVAVLLIIAVVSVAMLSVANAFFPKPDMRGKIFKVLNSICPSGVDDATALKEGYFDTADLSKLGIKLDEFNSEFGDGKTKVNNVYEALKGDNAGKFIVESEAQGRDGTIVMMTAFYEDGSIFAVQNLSNKESYWDRLPANFFGYFKDKKEISASDLSASTGATITITVGGITRAVNISVKIGALLNDIKEAPEEVTDVRIIAVLKSVSLSSTFTKYPLPADQNNKLKAIYKGDRGDVILAGYARGYGDMSLAVTVTEDLKIDKVAILENNEDFSGTDSIDFEESFTSAWLTAQFAGKTLSDIQAYGNSAEDNILSGTTGATLVRTARGIKNNLINCLTYYPSAADYIDSFAGKE